MMESWHPLACRRDYRVQFSGRGVGVECRAGAGVRRRGDLEAVVAHAAVRAGLPGLLLAAMAEAATMPPGLSQVLVGPAALAWRWPTIRTWRCCRPPARRR
jgi:hypothetical protein